MWHQPERSFHPPRTSTLVAALADPKVYPHPVERVELIETHISWVFLAGERVYKIKKPVDLDFLDFTTLARRRFYCHEEVRLNRRLAPDVYLGVVELKGSRHRPRFGGPGRTLEVAVEMRRLPAERMLDRLIRANAAPPDLMDAIAATLAGFHAAAASGKEIDVFGGTGVVRKNWEENFTQTAALGPHLLPHDQRQALRAYVDAFIELESHRFAERVRSGRIRDCHGDLQAQHVCCTEPIRIFDCIEFNHRFRFGDTASEIAFLAMDLERLGRSDLTIRFLNSYLEESGDYEALPLLDFYRAYRAFVRGKVVSFQVADHPELADQVRALFSLAARYAEPRAPARLIVMTGVMGSGKSTAARMIAARIGAIVIRTDAVRKRLGGLSVHERALHGFGEGLYTPEMGRQTYAETLRLAREGLVAGWSVIVDGSFSTGAERDEARDVADRLGVPFALVWCDAPDSEIVARLDRRHGDPSEVSDGRSELFSAHRARYESPEKEPDLVRVNTTQGPDRAIDDAIRLLRGK